MANQFEENKKILVEELYKRIGELREQLHERKEIEEVVRSYLLKSNMPIGEVSNVFYFLNLPNNKQEYTPNYRENEEELFKVLEMI